MVLFSANPFSCGDFNIAASFRPQLHSSLVGEIAPRTIPTVPTIVSPPAQLDAFSPPALTAA
jgi:hypothetical protein